MTEKIIGYRGLISGELILYISRILYHLELKVLVCDCSPDKELQYVIPENSYGSMVNECTEYGGVMHIDDLFNNELLTKYDAILINFGFARSHARMGECNYFYYVTDMDKINIDRLMNMETSSAKLGKDHLLIQNVVKGGIAVYACADELMNRLSVASCNVIMLNKRDIKIKSYAQYNNRFKFQDISKELYNYLFFCIWNIYSEAFGEKQINRAISKAMKGK